MSGHFQVMDNFRMNAPIITATPVLDRDRKIIGYELQPFQSADAGLSVAANVLSGLLTDFGVQWLRQGKLIFLSVSPEMLADQDFLALLPEGRTVLRVCGEFTLDQAFVDRCIDVRKRKIGLIFTSLDYARPSEHLFKLASHYELDGGRTDMELLMEQVALCRKFPGKTLMKNVTEGKAFWFFHKLEVDCFQGLFLRRPEQVKGKTLSPSQNKLIELLNKLNQNADVKVLEAVFKQDPALIVKLLNYVNCAALSGGAGIKSIGNAIARIGYAQLYRWVALLLYTSDENPSSPAVLRGLLTRSRFLELLGEARFPGQKLEELFITGMLSMLDKMFDTPLASILEKIELAPPIVEALLEHSGPLSPFLDLAEAYDDDDPIRIATATATLGLPQDVVSRLRLEAIAWADVLELP